MTAYFEVSRELGKDQSTMGFVPTSGNNILPQHPFHPTASPVLPDVPGDNWKYQNRTNGAYH